MSVGSFDSWQVRIGSILVLVGAVGFLRSCFIGLYRLPPPIAVPYNLYAQFVPNVYAWLVLFGSIAVVIIVSIVCALRPRRWTSNLLLATAVAWSLMLADFLKLIEVPESSILAGLWVFVASVACVVAGAVAISVAARQANVKTPAEQEGAARLARRAV